MNKLIKINENHYIICDDSEINEDQCYVGWETNYATEPKNRWVIYYKSAKCNGNPHYKVTHSFGKHLEGVDNRPLSEVEELINGYSVQTMAKQQTIVDEFNSEKSYVNGFNAHKELVKDKLFTAKDMRKALELGLSLIDGNVHNDEHFQSLIQSLLPKEWSVKFDEQGKLKLV
jgi:hypothetical protein